MFSSDGGYLSQLVVEALAGRMLVQAHMQAAWCNEGTLIHLVVRARLADRWMDRMEVRQETAGYDRSPLEEEQVSEVHSQQQESHAVQQAKLRTRHNVGWQLEHRAGSLIILQGVSS